jgi:glycosyltransferase involved in cell wall biosynthesis
VIASDRGGNGEVVRSGENGLLVRHPDPEALHAALASALDPSTRRRLAAGTRAGLERFSWTAAGPAIVEELETVRRTARRG